MSIPTIKDNCVEGTDILIDTPEWFKWLKKQFCFNLYFDDAVLSVCTNFNDSIWVAQLFKEYPSEKLLLGDRFEVTSKRLNQAYAILKKEMKDSEF